MKTNPLIRKLKLKKHPEGGYYRELYRAKDKVSTPRGIRNAATAIYFLLPHQEISALHRLFSDETLHFYAGREIIFWVLNPKTGKAVKHKLGPRQFQITVPAGSWFGSYLEKAKGYALIGCTVSPGFEFRDFEMADRAKLLKKFPQHRKMIQKLAGD